MKTILQSFIECREGTGGLVDKPSYYSGAAAMYQLLLTNGFTTEDEVMKRCKDISDELIQWTHEYLNETGNSLN